MLLTCLLLIPILGILLIHVTTSNGKKMNDLNSQKQCENNIYYKRIALGSSIINLIISLIIYISFDFSCNQFQFVQEHYDMSYFDIYLGIDGLSIYFVLLTTIIMPIALLSNWNSITENIKSYLIIMLLLETLLLAVFLVLDILLFYIFFESILPPLFLLIGLFGSGNKVRASYYIFLYTLGSSLFLLLAILTMSSIMGTTDFDALFKTNFDYTTQLFVFVGVFIAIAVKTPTIFLNNWLLRAHVESPLGGSIVLAAIVLKLSLYGIFRLILPILPQASLNYTYIVYLIGVITIIYASFSTLRTTDVKELIAYSSVSHAAVYLIGEFSNVIQGIEGSIVLGLGHGFVSSGLFICAGGVLYDRSGTRNIAFYRGMAQLMPLFSILFLILSLANCGTPLTLNFVGEFMCLYGTFERLPLLGAFAASSIVFSAAYSMYMFNRIAFGGSFSLFLEEGISDLTNREFFILFILVFFTVLFGVYPSFILDGLHYNVSSLIFSCPESFNCLSAASIIPLSYNQKCYGVRNFSTCSPLFLPDSGSDSGRSDSNSDSGSDSDGSLDRYIKKDGYALTDCPVALLKDDDLVNFIDDVRYLEHQYRDEGEQEISDQWADRLQELKDEANSRGVAYSDTSDSENSSGNESENGQEGENVTRSGVGSTSGQVDSNESENAQKGEGIAEAAASTTSEQDGNESDNVEKNQDFGAKDTSSSAGQENNHANSSLNNKRKAEDDESSIEPSKKFKQDSSDITADTEPYDFLGGEDS